MFKDTRGVLGHMFTHQAALKRLLPHSSFLFPNISKGKNSLLILGVTNIITAHYNIAI